MDRKPWIGSIPEADIKEFAQGLQQAERPLTAGVRPAIVVVDMTDYFVSGVDRVGDQRGTRAVEANEKLLAAARERQVPVFLTDAWSDPAHTMSLPEWGRWKVGAPVDPDSGRVVAPRGTVVPQLFAEGRDTVIHKGMKPSGFFGTPLASYLIQERVDTVIVTGISTSGCVRATVLDAFQHNFHVIVPFECVTDRSQISHDVTLFDLHMKYADVVSLAETQNYLGSVAVDSEGTTRA